MNSKKLNVIYNNDLNGECWTFYKMAVLETHPLAEQWLASHMNYFVNEDLTGRFGDNGTQYSMNYYTDILKFRKLSVGKVCPDNLIDVIKSTIDNEKYIIMYLNFDPIYGTTNVNHETLIYGYEETSIYCTKLKNGLFNEYSIIFDDLKICYENIYREYMHNGWLLICRRPFFFGITQVSLNDDYVNDNWIQGMLEKIRFEKNGCKIVKCPIEERETEFISTTYYEGLSALTYFADLFWKTDQTFWTDYRLFRINAAIKTAYDHRLLLLRNMKYFCNYMDAKDDISMVKAIDDYEKAIQNIKYVHLMINKYKINKNSEILTRIADICGVQYAIEKNALQAFEDTIWQYYFRENDVPPPPEDDE